MFFRFASGLILVVLISMAGIQLERSTLRMRRVVSRQFYQTDLLLELHAQLRLQTQRLTAMSRFPQHSRLGESQLQQRTHDLRPSVEIDKPERQRRAASRLPLLRFQQPYHPEGID